MAVGREYFRGKKLFGQKGIGIMLRCLVFCWVEIDCSELEEG